MMLQLKIWGERNFFPSPHRNTMVNWANRGEIYPPPQIIAGRYYVDENAKHIGSMEPIKPAPAYLMPSKINGKKVPLVDRIFPTVELLNKAQYRKIVGIYFLIDNDVVVYVGQSNDIARRISAHSDRNEKVFDSHSFVECEPECMSSEERKFINQYQPKYNIAHNSKRSK